MSDWSLFDTLTSIPDAGPARDRLIAKTWYGATLVSCPPYSENIAAAYSLEELISSHGHAVLYAQCLAVVLLESGIPNNEEDQWWQFAHATPEQRSKAALVAWAKIQTRMVDDGNV